MVVLDEGYDRLLSLAGQLIPWNFRFAYGSRSSLVSSDLAMLGVCQGLDGLARGVWALRYSHYGTLSGTVAEGQRVRIAFWLCSVLTSGTRVLISSEHLAVTTARAVCLVQD